MSEPGPAQTKLPHATKALLLLLVLNMLNYGDRQVLNALAPKVIREFQLTEAQFGLTTSVFVYAYMLAAPFLGQLALRISRWWLISGCVVIWSLASGFCLSGPLVSGFTFLLIMRIIVGVGEAGYGPAAPALLSDYFPPRVRGRVITIFYIAIPVGSALGFIYGGKMVPHWRWAFLILMPVGLTMAVLCFLMKDPRVQPEVAKAPEPFFVTLKKLLRIPSYVANTAAMTAMTFVIGGMSVWTSRYITFRKMSQENLEAYLALPPQSDLFQRALHRQDEILGGVSQDFGIIVVIAGITSTLLGGLVGEWLRTRIRGAYLLVSGGAIIFAFPCMLLMIYLPFPYAWFAVFGAVFFLFFNTGPANTALAGVTNSAMRGTAFAVNIFTIHAFGDALSPALIGWLSTQVGWNKAFLIVSPLVLIASTFWIIGSRYLYNDELRAEGKIPEADPAPAG
jgi:MFS transporter, Spinster family, sphingosine-1-phosphate transporter